MAKGDFVVTVRYNPTTKQMTCDNTWIRLFWETGPDTVRWIFEGFPAGTAIKPPQFLPGVPAGKGYGNLPVGVGLLAAGPAAVVDAGTPSFPGQPNDFVTTANRGAKGVFFYDIEATLPAAISPQPIHLDPGGTNDPTEPPTLYH